ncbi:MAG: NAD(P)/FAD-dependent oxidoreductase [Candidatus Lokiarchaeota archaeon]|nr:NAD(P)/FAD-dependent oxidoreductase [Candidatus Lokiarchaeota archaeon]
MINKFDALIVGGGVGGCAIGALLAHQGLKVKLFDKNNIIGGRCTTYEYEGFHIDLGVHLFGVGENGYLGDVCQMVGMPDAIKWVIARNPRPIMNYCGERKIYSRDSMSGMMGGKKEGEIKKEDSEKKKEGKEAARKFWSDCMDMPMGQIEELYYTKLSNFVSRYSKDPTLLMFATQICMQYFCVSPFEASSGEFIRCFQQVTRAKSSAYPIGGCIAIPKAYVNAMEKYGGEIQMNAKISKIVVEDGQAKGVELKDGSYHESDIIISNADIQNTVLNLIGEKYFPAEYVQQVKKLKYATHCMAIKVALDEIVTDQKLIMYIPVSFQEAGKLMPRKGGLEPPEKIGGMITSPTNFDPHLAPKGKQLIFFGSGCKPGLTQKEYERWGEACMDSLLECLPEAKGHVMWYRTDTPTLVDQYAGEGGNIIGVGQTVKQIHERRPSQITPIKGLYIVGAEAGGHGIGTELAANSAMELLEILEKSTPTS